MNLLHQGNRRRTTESTNANLTSSRSHAVFQIVVTSRSRTKNTEVENLIGKLSLIDLAGSERGTVTENRGLRLREGAKINRSLLALANCINALGDKSKKGFFVPYRDSKLTRLLKDSLGGNCRTVMIANISPSSSQFEETINTLKYANRAKNIKTKQVANKKLVAMHIAEYKNIINDLRSEIELLKQKLLERNTNNVQDEDDELQINNYVGKQYKQCSCSQPEDEQDMRKLREGIYENFQERIQLRRALMELEEQNAMNFLEIRKRQNEISQWKKDEDRNKRIPDDIKQAAKSIQTLKTSSEKNIIKKELMGLQLIENINNAKRIRDSIPKKIKNKDKRDFLELEIKNHVLELQNIELEINLQIQEKTIADLKSIIENQRQMMNQEEVISKVEDLDQQDIDDLLDEDDLIEIEQDEEDDELTELEDYKQMIKNKNSPKLDKRSSRIEKEQDSNRQPRDRSAPNHRQKQKQNKGIISHTTTDDNNNDQDDDSDNRQKQRIRDDSKPRKPAIPTQNINFVPSSQQQSTLQVKQPLPIINPPKQQQKQPPVQPDLSLNLKGNIMPIVGQKNIVKPPKKK